MNAETALILAFVFGGDPAPPPVVKQSLTTQAATRTVVTTRPSQGHTHTCPRCGTTWDHAANPGHNCPTCGTPQYIVDSPTRPVTIRRTVPVQSAAPRPAVSLATLQRSAVAYQNCPPSG